MSDAPKEKIRRFILDRLARHIEEKDLRDDLRLFETGTIDSLSIVTLVLHMEREFGIKVLGGEINAENFASIEAMGRFVGRKRGK